MLLEIPEFIVSLTRTSPGVSEGSTGPEPSSDRRRLSKQGRKGNQEEKKEQKQNKKMGQEDEMAQE